MVPPSQRWRKSLDHSSTLGSPPRRDLPMPLPVASSRPGRLGDGDGSWSGVAQHGSLCQSGEASKGADLFRRDMGDQMRVQDGAAELLARAAPEFAVRRRDSQYSSMALPDGRPIWVGHGPSRKSQKSRLMGQDNLETTWDRPFHHGGQAVSSRQRRHRLRS